MGRENAAAVFKVLDGNADGRLTRQVKFLDDVGDDVRVTFLSMRCIFFPRVFCFFFCLHAYVKEFEDYWIGNMQSTLLR